VTATERFKRLLADALERVCVLEEQLEQAHARIAELEQPADPTKKTRTT
jgi:cell division protein FtsB